jgi:hypothetical protein
MGKRNFDRPSFRTRGRSTESITGGDVPQEFRTTPRSLPQPKADLRREAEKALLEFKAKKAPSYQQQLEKVSIIPSGDLDDDDIPF